MVDLVSTSKVPHLKYPFPNFNPMQSEVFPFKDENLNICVMSPTGSGKTEVAELVMDSSLQKGEKALYVAPMKALVQEKVRKWRSDAHAFSKYKISELTGDHVLTPARIKELQEADIIVLTNEMLDSRCRRVDSEQSSWLLDVGTIVIDEVHLLRMEERGDALEVGLMRFTSWNQKARLVFISATVKNSEELAHWAYILNGKDTKHVRSDYRPIPLKVHYEPHPTGGKYSEREDRKIECAIDLLATFPKDDHVLFFVHTKPTGRLLLAKLKEYHFKVAFHNGDLSAEERHKVEENFKNGELDHLVATSTLAIGVNLPARRVIVVGTKRASKDVDETDILQEVGRAGRPGYDTEGDAYILVADNKFKEVVNRLQKEPEVKSMLTTKEAIGFHVISGIEQGELKSLEDIQNWYIRSFARLQGHELEVVLDQTISDLLRVRAISADPEEDLKALEVGKVAAWFYQPAPDVSAWMHNFMRILQRSKDPDDFDLAWALGNIESVEGGWLSDEFSGVKRAIEDEAFTRSYPMARSAVASVIGVFNLLKGEDIPPPCRPIVFNLRKDIQRTIGTIKTIGQLTSAYNLPAKFWSVLGIRIQMGAPRRFLPLIMLDQVGMKTARVFWENEIRSPKDVVAKADVVVELVGDKIGAKILASAKETIGKVVVHEH
jgi:replicative superfamily II helicase